MVTGSVCSTSDVSLVALARLRGAALDVGVQCADSVVAAELIDMLERTGGVRVVAERLPTTKADDIELLALLSDGATVREIGARLGYSTRTVQRRLAALRRELGVGTNREVVLAAGLR